MDNSINRTDNLKPILIFLSTLALSVLLFFIENLSGIAFVFPAISISLLLTYVIVKVPKYWIYSIIITSPLYLISNEADFDISDLISAIIWIGGLFIWLFYYVLVQKNKIIDDLSDWLFLFFYICLSINFFAAYFNGNELDIWIRTVARFCIPLLYFPIKAHIKTKIDLRNLLILSTIAFGILALMMLYETSIRLQNIKHAWEMGSILRLNQSLFGVALIVIISMIIFNKKIKNKLLLVLSFIPFIIVFITSMSRIFWFGLIVSVIYSIFFLPQKQRKTILISVLIIFSMAVLIGYALLGEKADFFLGLFVDRFTSIGNFMEDESFLVRFQEYGVAFTEIMKSPFIGNGFAHKIMYYSKLTSDTWHTSNVHNGYILITMRFGIPLAIIYYSVFTYKFFKTINILHSAKYSFEKMVLLGVSSGFILLFISNLLSASVMTRDGDFLIALMFGIIGITTRLIKEDVHG